MVNQLTASTLSFSSMPKKNVEGLLDELHAEIFCFQGLSSCSTR